MTMETQDYRNGEFKKLSTTDISYRVQVSDWNGNKTHYINITQDEYTNIVKYLTGKVIK